MKKITSFLFAIVLLCSFVSCQKETETKVIKVATLNGTTGFGMAYLMEQNAHQKTSQKYEFSVESDASVVMSSLINGEYDIAALPTNAASNLYNKTNGKFQILAINTLGVLYLVENGNTVSSLSDLEGKTVYVPAQNPYFILQYILNSAKIHCTVEVEPTALDLRSKLVANQVSLAVLPEPMVTIATSANASLRVAVDLNSEWEKIDGENTLAQGCIVANKEFIEKNPTAVSAFLSEYHTSIEYLTENTEEASTLIVKYNIFSGQAVAKKAIPNCNIVYLDGENMKTLLTQFYQSIYTVAPASIGNKIPDDGIYYVYEKND